ncbi:MAG: hemerythrin domain-containing protein [Candidatus Eisenbacteria bacterium]|nr:hemerythrin domain-containing protein [Candidatus Eisenbacteria bacterium]
MTTDPIQRLLDEHVELMSKFEPLRTAVHLLGEGGEGAMPRVLPLLREANRVMTTELLAHAEREDDVLFEAVEEELGKEFGPTVVMREEHRDIHGSVTLFRDTLHELNQVEHPAIHSSIGELQRLTESGAPAEVLRRTGANLIAMLDSHFGKEEEILFPIAREVLSRQVLAEVGRRMDELDRRGTAPQGGG